MQFSALSEAFLLCLVGNIFGYILMYQKRNFWSISNFQLIKKATLWSFFMDGVRLPQGYRATSRRQFTFYHQVPRKSWYSFDRPRKDERPVVLNKGPLDWESSALTTTTSLHDVCKFDMAIMM